MTAIGSGAAIFGCAGPVLTPQERDFFREYDPFGFIIFAAVAAVLLVLAQMPGFYRAMPDYSGWHTLLETLSISMSLVVSVTALIRTGDNKTVILPNGSLSNGHITNYSREPRRRADINIGIDYSSDIRQAREVLLKIAADPRVHRDPEPVVFVTGLGDSAVNLSLRVWVATPDFWPVTFGFTELAKERLTEAGIGIPFPQRVVHLVQPS